MSWPAYTWDRAARQFRGPNGQFARREDVRSAVDDTVAAAADEMEAIGVELQAGSIEVGEWQARMEAALKGLHTAAGAVAAGGWAQATAGDWGTVGARIARQYRYLRGFAIELEGGLPLDGRFLARARMYARGAPATYEAVLRRGDIAAGFDEERRHVNSADSCPSCPSYAAMGWQPAGTLPGIGEACECRGNCACSFERRRRPPRTRNSRSDTMPSKAPVGLDRIDREKCRRRNRVAARRDGVNAVPVRLYKSPPPAAASEPRRISAKGKLPANDAQALEKINANLPADSPPLMEEDVYIRYMEAANSSFVGDRFMFLAESTLQNIAADAEEGFAFMNSHRTGGMSQPSELPYGRAFCGRFERWTDGEGTHCRTLVGVYMLQGARPNGMNGPSTDDIARGIDGGTIFDVSVGLYDGQVVCDVCGNDLNDIENCPHVPGTTRGMSPAEIEAQAARGVPDGKASATLEDCHCREVSAVYDGAVPGAGFNKAISLSRRGRLSPKDRASARVAFATLARAGDFGPEPRFSTVTRSPKREEGTMPRIRLSDLLARLSGAGGHADPVIVLDETDDDDNTVPVAMAPARRAAAQAPPPPPAPQAAPAEDPRVAELQRQLETERAERKAKDRAAAEAECKSRAAAVAAQLKADNLLLPAGEAAVVGDLELAALDDLDHPLQGVSRFERRKAALEAATPHKLTKEVAVSSPAHLPNNLAALPQGAGDAAPTPERIAALIAATPHGRAVLDAARQNTAGAAAAIAAGSPHAAVMLN